MTRGRSWRTYFRPPVPAWILCLLCILIGYFTHFKGYAEPPFFFWDENYHVAHAQKYLHGVFFMEPHPPLGKLLIAAGEYLFEANEESNQFIGTDHAKNSPKGFSFAGYRFFPALLSWFTAPVLYWIFVLITGRVWWALCLSALYLFDNALIVHGRGAMLEGTQLFFVALMILGVVLLLKHRRRPKALTLLLGALVGASFAAAMVTKVNALILCLLFPVMLWHFRKNWWLGAQVFASLTLAGLLVYVTVWQIHFSMARNIDARLPNAGWYQASPEYKGLVEKGDLLSVRAFPLMLRDSLAFVSHYQKGVPKLNLCAQNENGSPAILWPFGGRTINYRWERKDGKASYLYLVSNPASWTVALLVVLASIGTLCAQWFLGLRSALRNQGLIFSFAAMYVGYMVVMMNLPRVMYLYHYFIPLIIAYVLCGLLLREVRSVAGRRLNSGYVSVGLTCLSALVWGAYSFMSPLTYSQPLSDEDLRQRSWAMLWDLRPAGADPANGIAKSLCDPKVKPAPDVAISGIRASKGFQDWGEPRQNVTVEQLPLIVGGQTFAQGIGVHAISNLEFPLKGQFSRFTGKVGLPDYLKEKTGAAPRLRFEILGDGRLLWDSDEVTLSSGAKIFDLSVAGVQTLTLSVRPLGDGIDNHHANWLEPTLSR